jgi:predicted TPR repeat methyltransferase
MIFGQTDNETVIAQFKKAMQLHVEGRLSEAETLYREVLRQIPGHFDALHNLGVLHLERRDHQAALTLLNQALGINPRGASAHLNIGNVLRDLKRPEESIVSYDRAIALVPGYAQAHNNRGVALRDLKRPAEAIQSYLRAVALKPDYAEAFNNCAAALLDLKRFEEALASAERALAIKPTFMEAHLNCGHARYGLKQDREAIAAYRAALDHGGNMTNIQYYLAALGAEQPPTESPKIYVENLFDHYAETFDKSLLGLKYNIPELMFNAVVSHRGNGVRDIADLGCGTGMCGPLFRAIAQTLVGVDLSSKMLTKAAERGAYDQLINAELGDFLSWNSSAFDLIIAADVFVYIGDLDPIFGAVRMALRSGGAFAFSVEGYRGDGFTLRKSRRFAHAPTYLHALAEKHGFVTNAVLPVAVRQEEGSDIDGFIVLLTMQ